MHSHSTLPAGVRARIARCPMANAGVVSIVVSPAARRRNLLLCAFRSVSNVVQDCPEAGTNWRSSMQTGHVPGEASDGGYCVPQAEQMNAGMISPFGRRKLAGGRITNRRTTRAPKERMLSVPD